MCTARPVRRAWRKLFRGMSVHVSSPGQCVCACACDHRPGCPFTCHDGHFAAQVQISWGAAVVSTGVAEHRAVWRGSSGALLRAQCAVHLGQAGGVMCAPQNQTHLKRMNARGWMQLSKVRMRPKPWSSRLSSRFMVVLAAADGGVADLVLAGVWAEENLLLCALCKPLIPLRSRVGGHTNAHFTGLTSPRVQDLGTPNRGDINQHFCLGEAHALPFCSRPLGCSQKDGTKSFIDVRITT